MGEGTKGLSTTLLRSSGRDDNFFSWSWLRRGSGLWLWGGRLPGPGECAVPSQLAPCALPYPALPCRATGCSVPAGLLPLQNLSRDLQVAEEPRSGQRNEYTRS